MIYCYTWDDDDDDKKRAASSLLVHCLTHQMLPLFRPHLSASPLPMLHPPPLLTPSLSLPMQQVVPPLLGRRQLDARGCPSSLRRRPCFTVRSEVGSAAASSVGSAVDFPTSYDQLLEQAKESAESALKDGKQLLEIEFPTAGLDSVPGDGEGGIEMTESMQLIREFCDLFVMPQKATRTRIFFPEANEVEFARKSVFGGASFKLDYLTKPSLFEDFGISTKVKMADRVKPDDEMFLVAYPYFNVNEMLVVEELYKEAVLNTTRSLIIFNGELDRIRSGYYPSFFYPKLGALTKTFLPIIETVYYIHNFKGSRGGTLFRCYPGPWRVLRKASRRTYICIHEQEAMPSLKEVALNILPSA